MFKGPKADLDNGATVPPPLKRRGSSSQPEHLRTRAGHTMPTSVTCVAVFCDESLFSVPPECWSRFNWCRDTFKQVMSSHLPQHLTSDDEYITNMRRFNDPTDSMTRLMEFGSVGANNARRSAEGRARKVSCLIEFASCYALNFFPYLNNLTSNIAPAGPGAHPSCTRCSTTTPFRTRTLLAH